MSLISQAVIGKGTRENTFINYITNSRVPQRPVLGLRKLG